MYSEKQLVFLQELENDVFVLEPAIFEVSRKNVNAYRNNSKHSATLRFESYIRKRDDSLIKQPIEFYKNIDGKKELQFIVYGTPDIRLTIEELLRAHRVSPIMMPFIINTFIQNLPIVVNFSTDKTTKQIDYKRFDRLCREYLHECFIEKPPLSTYRFLENLTQNPCMKNM